MAGKNNVKLLTVSTECTVDCRCIWICGIYPAILTQSRLIDYMVNSLLHSLCILRWNQNLIRRTELFNWCSTVLHWLIIWQTQTQTCQSSIVQLNLKIGDYGLANRSINKATIIERIKPTVVCQTVNLFTFITQLYLSVFNSNRTDSHWLLLTENMLHSLCVPENII